MRKKINKKALLGAGVLLCIAAIIGVQSFLNFIIDPSQWGTKQFWTKEVMAVVITIAGVVTSMFIGQAKNDDDERSEIAKARVRFAATIKQTKEKGKSAFCQWVKDVQQPNDTNEKLERLMAKHGITQKEVFSLEIPEIRALLDTPQKYGETFYHALTKRQIEFVLEYKEGRYAIDFVTPEYYLTYSSINNDKTISEKAGKETKTKTILLSVNLISKIVRGLLFAMILASLAYDATTGGGEGGEAAQRANAWMTFVSRMATLMTAIVSGYALGSKENDVEADYINMRCEVQESFLADKTYRAKTESELAKQEYIERVRSENVLAIEENGERG